MIEDEHPLKASNLKILSLITVTSVTVMILVTVKTSVRAKTSVTLKTSVIAKTSALAKTSVMAKTLVTALAPARNILQCLTTHDLKVYRQLESSVDLADTFQAK